MNCIYAKTTKSGRFRCTYNEDIEKGEGDKSSSPLSSLNPKNIKMCPYQEFCRKRYKWEGRGQNKCKHFKENIGSNVNDNEGQEVKSNG